MTDHKRTTPGIEPGAGMGKQVQASSPYQNPRPPARPRNKTQRMKAIVELRRILADELRGKSPLTMVCPIPREERWRHDLTLSNQRGRLRIVCQDDHDRQRIMSWLLELVEGRS